MCKVRLKLVVFGTILLLVTSIYAQSGRQQVSEGNRLFTEEKYDEANNAYRDALLDDPESDIIQFNIGDTQYKKKKYEEALKEFEGVLDSDDIIMQSNTYYNMGNTFYRMGKLPESILSYKRALELNPDDLDAKYNLEFVRKKLKDQAEKQPQENQQQQQQQQQEQQQGDQQEQQEEKEQEQQQQDQQDQQNQEQQQEEQQQAAKESQEDISKEDAERILNALKESDKELKDARKQKGRGSGRVAKDW